MRAISGLLLIALLTPTGAGAVDGAVEINQACAQVGCFPGDPPGFPVRIVEPGSYRLTSNLVPTNSLGIIDVFTSNVTIDLNGFAILGPNSCVGGVPGGNCTHSGGGAGIFADAGAPNGGANGVTVRNGTVRGMSTTAGILLLANSRVENVIVEQNNAYGIIVGTASAVVGSIARRNALDGITGDRGSRVSDSVADLNGGTGIRNLNGDVLVESCTANSNGGDGINVGANSLLRGNLANSNTADGIQTGSRSLLLQNIANFNLQTGIVFGTLNVWGLNEVCSSGAANISGSPTSLDCNNVCGQVGHCPP